MNNSRTITHQPLGLQGTDFGVLLLEEIFGIPATRPVAWNVSKPQFVPYAELPGIQAGDQTTRFASSMTLIKQISL